MFLLGICRIGNQPELKTTSTGAKFVSLSLAYTYGQKGTDGYKPTQWVRASIWNQRAESLAPYLNKGDKLFVSLSDVHVRTFESGGETKTSLEGFVDKIELLGGGKPAAQTEHEKAKANGYQTQAAELDADGDIPF